MTSGPFSVGKWRQVGGRPIGLVSPVFAREGPGCGGVGALEHRFPCPVLYEYQQVQVPRTHGLGLMSRESDTPALLSPPCILSPPTRLTVTATPGILVGGDSRDSEDKGSSPSERLSKISPWSSSLVSCQSAQPSRPRLQSSF